MREDRRDRSIAKQLESMRWDHPRHDDRRFLFDPIGRIFGNIRWDEKTGPIRLLKRSAAGGSPRS